MERRSEQRGREGAARKGGSSEEGREQWSEGVSREEGREQWSEGVSREEGGSSKGAAREGGSNGARE